MGTDGGVKFVAGVVPLKVDVVAPVAHADGSAVGGLADEFEGRVVARIESQYEEAIPL